jgi:hypothetical protein
LLARFGLPRSRLSSAIGPDCCLACMSKRPSRVSLTTSAAEMQAIIASQLSRRASSARQDGLDVILEEEHAGEDDVGLLDVVAAALERVRHGLPNSVAKCRSQLEARHLLAQGHPAHGRRHQPTCRSRVTKTRTGTLRKPAACQRAEMRFGIVQASRR